MGMCFAQQNGKPTRRGPRLYKLYLVIKTTLKNGLGFFCRSTGLAMDNTTFCSFIGIWPTLPKNYKYALSTSILLQCRQATAHISPSVTAEERRGEYKHGLCHFTPIVNWEECSSRYSSTLGGLSLASSNSAYDDLVHRAISDYYPASLV